MANLHCMTFSARMLSLWIFASLLGIEASAEPATKKCDIFYLPFNVATYVPVLMDDIERLADYKISMDFLHFEKLFSLINSFNQKRAVEPEDINVRVKVTCAHAEGSPIYIQQSKSVCTSTHLYSIPKSVVDGVINSIVAASKSKSKTGWSQKKHKKEK